MKLRERLRRTTDEGAPKSHRGRNVGTMILLGAVGGGIGVHAFEDWRNGDIAAKAKQDCESTLNSNSVRVSAEIVVPQANVEALVNAALNPLVAEHSDSAQLDDIGYTAIQDAASKHGFVEVTVPFSMSEPFADKKELKRLTADADLLSKLIRSRLSDDQNSIVSVVPVPAQEAYPAAPMTVVVGDQFCE